MSQNPRTESLAPGGAKPPRPLLDELPAAVAEVSSYQPLFTAFEGELLARLGRSAEAATRLESALRQARFQYRNEPNYRVHLPILEGRLAALAP